MEYFRVGLVLKPQGIKGEIKIEPLTDDLSRFSKVKTLHIELACGHEPANVRSAVVRNGAVYLTLEGYADRSAVEALRGKYLCVTRDEAVELPEGRYFISDLVGCDVFDSAGKPLGKLAEVLQYGAADVYVIKGERSLMAPALKRLLQEVDVALRKIVLDAGVLEEVGVFDED